jgi:hypothetical protein
VRRERAEQLADLHLATAGLDEDDEYEHEHVCPLDGTSWVHRDDVRTTMPLRVRRLLHVCPTCGLMWGWPEGPVKSEARRTRDLDRVRLGLPPLGDSAYALPRRG